MTIDFSASTVPVDCAEATAGMNTAVEQRKSAVFFTKNDPRLNAEQLRMLGRL
jgi:hypothetical protein